MEYHNDEYVITNKISDENIKEMRNNMNEVDIEEFDKFIERNWGKTKMDTVLLGTNKRGRKPKAD